MKRLFIISGCNGAGKTTASYTILPEILDCEEFVNADEIIAHRNTESSLVKNTERWNELLNKYKNI
ncbi:hypothetical protein [Saccharicrinis fermentans]|uniref:UDP-N-acetylglucosamine kinase n=1 Tax=Saccharicrinis fermentans DSM 9555 = JCM 21142 TaxID=869213 RepID=W7YEM3_9BACT|nr:hypothetical protein [Saccharicrinis fermentans]GAF05923.1 hypothetical protein JCM21142_124684 [Saccharicrinis fermentans DSM 9555 = JCM 21142]